MKEATGELNLTVVTVIAIAALAAIVAVLYPMIRKSIANKSCKIECGNETAIAEYNSKKKEWVCTCNAT